MISTRRAAGSRAVAAGRLAAALAPTLAGAALACRAPAATTHAERLLPPSGSAAEPALAPADGRPVEQPRVPAPAPPLSAAAVGPLPVACPDDMAHVVHEFCPVMQRHCSDSEYEPSNHITICHRFVPGQQRCLEARLHLDFCIDRYEYPNRAGAHPPVMIDWHEAERLCAAAGKRLCTESEWTAACEGPDELPFPYGHARDGARCNIDQPWRSPQLSRLHSPNPAVRDAELGRLDQGVPSGARPGCVSGYGVFDLTGNFDEWVRADLPRVPPPRHAAALKGGAWGHVRNACRPVTTSHAPSFVYYFVSTRCCMDPVTAAGG